MHPHERLRETASSVPDADNLWAAGGKWRRAVRPASTKVMEPKHSCGFAALYAHTFVFCCFFFSPQQSPVCRSSILRHIMPANSEHPRLLFFQFVCL